MRIWSRFVSVFSFVGALATVGVIYAADVTIKTDDGKVYKGQISEVVQSEPTPAPLPIPEVSFGVTVEPDDNQVLDGKGQTIDVTKLKKAFLLQSVKNVTIKNYKIKAGGSTIVFDIRNSDNVKLENIEIANDANYVIRIIQSARVRVTNVNVPVSTTAYFGWVEGSTDVKFSKCKATGGSRHETTFRAMYVNNLLTIEDCEFKNTLNKQTVLRLHDGTNYVVNRTKLEGICWFGPMGGDDGGQTQTDPAKRAKMLAYFGKTFYVKDCEITGAIGFMAGLSEFLMSGGSITTKKELPFNDYVYNNNNWSYPEKQHLKPGDVKRPAPSGTLSGVQIKTFKIRKTLDWNNGAGPLKLIDVDFNGTKMNR